MTTVSPIIWTVLYTLYLTMFGFWHVSTRSLNGLSASVVPLYFVARVILLVVAFSSLRSLPPAAYETVYWTTLIPHV